MESKLTGDDIWEQCSYVLSAKLADPQFAGRTRSACHLDKLRYLSPVLQKTLSACGSMNTPAKASIAELAINNAQKRIQAAKKVARKRVTAGPALPGKLADCSGQDAQVLSCFWWKVNPLEAARNKQEIASSGGTASSR